MEVHYFQRYHNGEDMATANTMLLLSRLYSYSPNKFFQFIKEQYFSDAPFEPEIRFTLQDKSKESRPDATITQPSFKLVIETKLYDWFKDEQLVKHLEIFKDEEYKILITLSPEKLSENRCKQFDELVLEYSRKHGTRIIHINTTFESIANGIKDVLHEHDFEMQDILNDYYDYCYRDNLIVITKKMRMQLAGTTIEFNMAENVYYDNLDRGFSSHEYLALYTKKSIRAVGKINAIITAVVQDGMLKYNEELGELTDERKDTIQKAIEDGKQYGYKLDAHRYFFVEKFYETDFKKITPRAPMGTRMFDLTEVLGTEKLPETDQIAQLLKNKTWE